MLRRSFLLGAPALARPGKPRILVRSGWQTVNIGDIAHTPGLLALLERHIPEAQVTLWPVELDRGAEPMLKRRFAQLEILRGSLDDVSRQFSRFDLFLHGSAASAGGRIAEFETWRRQVRKPYGYFGVGVTLEGEAAGAPMTERLKAVLSQAAFIFTRETASLKNLALAGIQGPEMAFAPDATFSMDLKDESRAAAFLRQSGLKPGAFICAIPRLRYTPYHKIRKVDWSPQEIERRERVNAQHAEVDHAKLRYAITDWVRNTGGQALLCPEMTYQLELLEPLLWSPLPEDVKRRTAVRRQYWLPDEAASVYRQAAAVVSFECHSPILAAVQGTPCLYLRQREDGIKGQMWQDLGLGDWCLEIEHTSGEQIAAKLHQITRRSSHARNRVKQAVRQAREVQGKRMQFISGLLSTA